MPGVPGAGGPPPKRSTQRRRRNEPAHPVVTADGAAEVPVPDADPQWHPVARRWFESLAASGQSVFYEPSDWATAFAVAESMSRELNPQPVTVGKGDDTHVEMVSLPPKGASLAAWLKAMSSLLVTEGDRRRVSVELQRPERESSGEANDVSRIEDARRRRSTRDAG